MKHTILSLIALIFALSLTSTHSQSQYQLVAQQGTWQDQATAISPSQVVPISGPYHLFLSHVGLSPSVSIQFGTGVANGELLEPSQQFSYGLTSLYYRYQVSGAKDLSYRAEWHYNDQLQPQLTDSGTILSNNSVFTNNFCNFTLEPCNLPLPSGTYSVTFYLDDQLINSAAAIISE